MITLPEAAARLSRAVISLKKRREKDRLARIHQRKIAAFFQAQKAQVLDKLKDQQYLFTESYRKLREDTTQFTLQNWDRIWDDIAQNSNGDLQRIIFGAEVDGVSAGAVQLRSVLTFDPKTAFNLANPRAVKWFVENGGSVDKIRGIQDTTAGSLRRVITTALDEGWSYQSTAREIQKLYDIPISRNRAQRIAVFETGKSYEAGNRLFAESLESDGVIMEEHWMTSHDEKVRPEHAANEAEGWVEMGHVFSNGHTEPPTDPGCRCYMIFRQAGKET
jgi:uncharacterized protein with gpF-like domain